MNIVRLSLMKHCPLGPIRRISTTPILQQQRALAKLKRQQAEFQCDDGKPIYLKRGVCDRLLYSSTLVGCVVGFCMVVALFYDHAKPPSWKTGSAPC